MAASLVVVALALSLIASVTLAVPGAMGMLDRRPEPFGWVAAALAVAVAGLVVHALGTDASGGVSRWEWAGRDGRQALVVACLALAGVATLVTAAAALGAGVRLRRAGMPAALVGSLAVIAAQVALGAGR